MPDKQTTSRDLSDLPILLVSREEAKQRLSDQITRGTAFLESLDERIKALPPEKGFIHILTNGHPRYDLSLESREEYEQWMKYIETLFAITFKGDEYLTEFRRERAKPDLSLVSHYVDSPFRRFVRTQITTLESIKERVNLLDGPVGISADSQVAVDTVVSGTNVFVVHGRDRGVRETVARFVEHLGLNPIILDDLPSSGRTVIEKFERSVVDYNVRYAIVLMTPDDIGTLASEVDNSSARARQNVIFELGYFVGKLGRENVCPLVKGEVEIPSDFYGVVYVALDDFDGWKIKLESEIAAAGLPIDKTR